MQESVLSAANSLQGAWNPSTILAICLACLGAVVLFSKIFTLAYRLFRSRKLARKSGHLLKGFHERRFVEIERLNLHDRDVLRDALHTLCQVHVEAYLLDKKIQALVDDFLGVFQPERTRWDKP
jgi:hypothetical protein